ncbi:hypothetical protein DIPPA_15354, partial [Diplonema papillatum]
ADAPRATGVASGAEPGHSAGSAPEYGSREAIAAGLPNTTGSPQTDAPVASAAPGASPAPELSPSEGAAANASEFEKYNSSYDVVDGLAAAAALLGSVSSGTRASAVVLTLVARCEEYSGVDGLWLGALVGNEYSYDSSLAWELHPAQLSLGSGVDGLWLGALVGNVALFAAACLACCLLPTACLRLGRVSSWDEACGRTMFPGVLIAPALFLSPGTAFAAVELLGSPPSAIAALFALAAVLCCAGVPVALAYAVVQHDGKKWNAARDESWEAAQGGIYFFAFGPRLPTSTNAATPHFAEKWCLVADAYRPRRSVFAVLEAAHALVVAVLCALSPNVLSCQVRTGACSAVCAAYAGLLIYVRPFSSRWGDCSAIGVSAAVFLVCGLEFMSYFKSNYNIDYEATVLPGLTLAYIACMVRGIADICRYYYGRRIGRRCRALHLAPPVYDVGSSGEELEDLAQSFNEDVVSSAVYTTIRTQTPVSLGPAKAEEPADNPSAYLPQASGQRAPLAAPRPVNDRLLLSPASSPVHIRLGHTHPRPSPLRIPKTERHRERRVSVVDSQTSSLPRSPHVPLSPALSFDFLGSSRGGSPLHLSMAKSPSGYSLLAASPSHQSSYITSPTSAEPYGLPRVASLLGPSAAQRPRSRQRAAAIYTAPSALTFPAASRRSPGDGNPLDLVPPASPMGVRRQLT